MLQTATAIATSEDGSKSARVNILFDSGSQRSYITNGLKSRLNIKPRKTETLHFNTFGERSYRKQKCEVSPLLLQSNKNENFMISALSFPVICSPLSTRIEVDQYPHLQGLQLADSSDSNGSIDVLIRSDYYWVFIEGDIGRGEFGPVAIDSKFGWLLSGSTDNGLYNETSTTNLVIGSSDSQFETTQNPLVDVLEKFWKTESIGIKGDLEHKQINESFNESVRFNGSRYYHGNKVVLQYRVIISCVKTAQIFTSQDVTPARVTAGIRSNYSTANKGWNRRNSSRRRD